MQEVPNISHRPVAAAYVAGHAESGGAGAASLGLSCAASAGPASAASPLPASAPLSRRASCRASGGAWRVSPSASRSDASCDVGPESTPDAESTNAGRCASPESALTCSVAAPWGAASRSVLAPQPTAAQTGADDWALAHVDRWWRDHLGAAVLRMRPASRIDRTRIEFFAALARRQPTLEVAWGDACLASATSAQRAAFVAPVSAAEARRYAQARGVTAWWTPTDRSYTALREAGLGADQVRLARLGTHTSEPSARTGRAVVGISETAPEIADALARVFPAVHIVTFRADRPTTFAGVDIVCAAGPTDRWGLLLPAALGHGCAVVTTPPVDPLIASATGVSVVPREQLIDALVAEIASIDTVRAHALETFLDAKRRLDGYLATQHISELARALTGGVPSTSRVAVSAEDARRLRSARAAGVAGAG